MKKIILLIMLITTLFSDNTFLFSGLSKHGHNKDDSGQKFESVHYGLGYQYSSDLENDIYKSFTVLAFKDSYSNMMYSATYGYNYMSYNNFNFRASIGSEFGLAYKKVYAYKKFEYKVIPIAFIPTIKLEYKKVSLNLLYVPKLNLKNGIKTESVLYLNFGIKL